MHVIFDLDGTVWDSEAGIIGCIEHTLEEFGLAAPSREVMSANVGPPLHRMLVELGVPASEVEEGVRIYRERYASWGAYQAEVYPGIEDLLDELTGSGRRLATATSKGEDPTHQMLHHFGLTGHFEVVGAASMDASAASKEAVIARALSGLAGPDPSTCVMVGDRHYDVTGAHRFGIECVGVTWGYGTEDELRAAGVDRLVHDVAELRDVLLSRAAARG